MSSASRQYVFSEIETSYETEFDSTVKITSGIENRSNTKSPILDIQSESSLVYKSFTDTVNVSTLSVIPTDNNTHLVNLSTVSSFTPTTVPSNTASTSTRGTPDWGFPTRWPHYRPKHASLSTVKPSPTPRFREFDWLYCPTVPTSTPSTKNIASTTSLPSMFEATTSHVMMENSRTSLMNDWSSVQLGIGFAFGKDFDLH